MIKFLLLLTQNKKKITVESIKELKSHYLFDDTFDLFVERLQEKCRKKDKQLIEKFYGKLFGIVMEVEV